MRTAHEMIHTLIRNNMKENFKILNSSHGFVSIHNIVGYGHIEPKILNTTTKIVVMD